MTQDLIWAYILNLIINSFLAFVTIALLVQLLITLLRIKQPRLKALLLSIPFLKLAFDPFLYDFQNWALLHQINPLEAEIGSRALSLMLCFPSFLTNHLPLTTAIRLTIYNEQTFTVADLVMLACDPKMIHYVILVTGFLSLVFLLMWFYRFVTASMRLRHLSKQAQQCYRPIFNLALLRQLNYLQVVLIHSEAIPIPCAFGVFNKRIGFPTQLVNQLSQEEFEAVVAHELDHLKWQDGPFRVGGQILRALFWWIPTCWWQKRIEQLQERACDAKISHFNIAKLDLASAIVKTVKATKCPETCMLITCFVQKHAFLKRLHVLIAMPEAKTIKRRYLKWLQMGFVAILATSILFGKFWIF